MKTKKVMRLKRATKARMHIKQLGAETGIPRVCIMRSPRHIYAQIIAPVGGDVIATASSLELRKDAPAEGAKIGTAKKVGALLAERAKEKGVTRLACDRSGFSFHGRVAALVEVLREAGIHV